MLGVTEKDPLLHFGVMSRETLPVAIAVGTIVYLMFYFVPQLDAAPASRAP